jgi:hypothetical protein
MNHVEIVEERETALNIKSILVAVDLSSHSDRTVAYAVSVARQFGASLRLIHVYAPPSSIEFGTKTYTGCWRRTGETQNDVWPIWQIK